MSAENSDVPPPTQRLNSEYYSNCKSEGVAKTHHVIGQDLEVFIGMGTVTICTYHNGPMVI